MSSATEGSVGPSIQLDVPVALVDASGESLDPELSDYYVRVRAGFGFDASGDVIQSIIDEHGIAFEWGFPLMPEELKEIERRLVIQQALPDDVILGFVDLPGYGGFYFDHSNGGAPTIAAVDVSQIREPALESVPPALRDQVRFVRVDHSWLDLRAAADALVDSSDALVTAEVHRVAIKTVENRLDVSILSEDRLFDVETRVRAIVDVRLTVRSEPLAEHEACTSRSDCHSPMRAGVKLVQGSSAGTLGFGIEHGTDDQYVTAGHFVPSGNGFYSHPGLGDIGSTAESEYVDNGIDARAIYASDSQVSDDIYVTSSFKRDVNGEKYPSVGVAICLSGLKTVSCGTVQDNYVTYSTSTVSNLKGATGDYTSKSGDSGGPVYFISGSSKAKAVGIHSSGGGDREFARVWDLPTRMGAFVKY